MDKIDVRRSGSQLTITYTPRKTGTMVTVLVNLRDEKEAEFMQTLEPFCALSKGVWKLKVKKTPEGEDRMTTFEAELARYRETVSSRQDLYNKKADHVFDFS